MRPLLLVDVDGVLSVLGPRVDREDCLAIPVEGAPPPRGGPSAGRAIR